MEQVLPEKLKVSQLVKNFPLFYETRMLTTAYTKARHLFLTRARPIISTPIHLIS
jgi:hypothetical protein